MNVADTLKNPYVIGGGVLVGLILLGMAHSASGATAGGANVANPVFTTAVLENNKAALAATTQQAQIAGNVAIARANDITTVQVATLDAIKAADSTRAVVASQFIQSQSGIIQSQIQSSAAVAIDINNNMARLGMAQQETNQTQIRTNGAVEIAKVQASAVKHATDMNTIGNVIKVGASVLAAPFTGGASLAGLASVDAGGAPTGSSLPVSDLVGLY